ncbi:VacJ family lipoprotein, partial [Burkholderia pseudomallei]|uniref:MlaA family lipoprotein n=1 Tax=Burkholderia pseudomallei TaxID=28450 RepID=UPI00136C64D9
DYLANPLTYVKPDGVSYGLFGVNLVNTRANLLGAGDVLEAAAIDKYSFVRNAYLQRRQMLVSNARGEAGGASDGDALPKYDLPDDGAAAPAAAAAPAPGSEAAGSPNPASATNVPPMQVTPPAPGGLRIPSIRLH